jgi:hypothetical protein
VTARSGSSASLKTQLDLTARALLPAHPVAAVSTAGAAMLSLSSRIAWLASAYYRQIMPTMTIRLTRRESARVARLAKKRMTTRSKLVRDAIAKLEDSEPRTAYDDWRDFFGVVDSGVTDLATNPRHLKGLGRWRE